MLRIKFKDLLAVTRSLLQTTSSTIQLLMLKNLSPTTLFLQLTVLWVQRVQAISEHWTIVAYQLSRIHFSRNHLNLRVNSVKKQTTFTQAKLAMHRNKYNWGTSSKSKHTLKEIIHCKISRKSPNLRDRGREILLANSQVYNYFKEYHSSKLTTRSITNSFSA